MSQRYSELRAKRLHRSLVQWEVGSIPVFSRKPTSNLHKTSIVAAIAAIFLKCHLVGPLTNTTAEIIE